MTGTVKCFKPDKGWGFISPDGDGKDVFCHYSDIMQRGTGFRTLVEGQRVDFDVVDEGKGPKATNITVQSI
jgi:CspA family cold shock protein